MDVANRFVDSGFSSALIQSQEVTHADESTVFWFTVISGAVVALALLAAAPVIAGVFSLPILIPLTEIMALGIFISALGSIQATLLTKKLDFRTQMKVGGIATIISGVIAITMAWRGYGVWSLAAQAITASAVTTMLLWFFSEWRPAFIFCRGAVKRYFGFGGFLLLSGLVDCLYRRSYTLLIGRFYGVSELGFYNRAYDTQQLPASTLSDVLAKVAFPVFSSAAH